MVWAWGSDVYDAGVPVINYTLLTSDDLFFLKIEENKLLSALENIGFFILTNHHMDQRIMGRMWNTARAFFDSDQNNKMAIQMNDEYMYGYTAAEILSRSETKEGYGHKPDAKETFNVMIGAKGKFYGSQYVAKWPPKPSNMEHTHIEYYREVEVIVSNLLRAVARMLDLSLSFFEDKIDNHLSCLRMINYPAQKFAPEKGVLRCSPHTDYGTFTIVWQDNIGGLQIEKTHGANNWVDVKTRKCDFSVNIGDLMARWTNDRFRSTRHRVVNAEKLGSQNRRQTIVFFHNLNAEATVETIPSCLIKGKSKYKPITFTKYLENKHHATQIYNKEGMSRL